MGPRTTDEIAIFLDVLDLAEVVGKQFVRRRESGSLPIAIIINSNAKQPWVEPIGVDCAGEVRLNGTCRYDAMSLASTAARGELTTRERRPASSTSRANACAAFGSMS